MRRTKNGIPAQTAKMGAPPDRAVLHGLMLLRLPVARGHVLMQSEDLPTHAEDRQQRQKSLFSSHCHEVDKLLFGVESGYSTA